MSYITANLEEGVALGEAVARVREALGDLRMPEGFSVYFGGEYEKQQRAQAISCSRFSRQAHSGLGGAVHRAARDRRSTRPSGVCIDDRSCLSMR